MTRRSTVGEVRSLTSTGRALSVTVRYAVSSGREQSSVNAPRSWCTLGSPCPNGAPHLVALVRTMHSLSLTLHLLYTSPHNSSHPPLAPLLVKHHVQVQSPALRHSASSAATIRTSTVVQDSLRRSRSRHKIEGSMCRGLRLQR